jgi:hypothetical protein
MAYTINRTDGTILATIPDGTVNTSSTSLKLVGKNYAGYGEFLDENFVHLLENSANGTPPVNPMRGQLWWDSSGNLLKVYNGSTFKTISAATAAAAAPSSNVTGDLWFDTVNQQLKAYNGTSFIVVGPSFTSAEGTAGAVPETIADNVGVPHFVTSTFVNNERVAIFSKDANFVPAAPLNTAFPTIYSGVTLPVTGLGGSAVFAGTATNADLLDNLNSTQFLRADANTATTGTLHVNNNSGLTVGTGNAVAIVQTSNDGAIRNTVSGGNILLQANVGGVNTTVAQALGANGSFAIANAATVGGNLTVTGMATAGNISTAGTVTATGNITGSNMVGTTLVTAPTITATGNVNANNVSVSNVVTAGRVITTGNITAGAGAFFIGDGSQLSGLSAAVSVTKIVNGTSEANVASSGGNITFTVGGTANVVVIDNTTIYANVARVNNITTPGNGVANVGSASNRFNTVHAAQFSGSGALLSSIDAGNISSGTLPTGRLSGSYSISVLTAGTAGTVTTGAQPNITSVGTLTSLAVSGNITTPGAVSLSSITKTGTSGVGNIGSSANSFNTVFATATSALYADLAERYAADAEYAPGTVVELGGLCEITQCTQPLSTNVFGVISSNPAHLMNQQAGPDSTHPAVALLGRVPVMVVGAVNKHDRLVSAGAGMARAAQQEELTAFNIIGRALESKPGTEPGLVEAVVRVNI